MSEDQDATPTTAEHDDQTGGDPRHDAARLGLVVVGEANALLAGDEEALDASTGNLHDTVDELVDEPLTPRQEEVVERLTAASGSLTAGLAGALAARSDHTPSDVLEGAARSLVWQDRFATEGVDADHDRDDHRGDRRDDGD